MKVIPIAICFLFSLVLLFGLGGWAFASTPETGHVEAQQFPPAWRVACVTKAILHAAPALGRSDFDRLTNTF